ncbi:VOC family protein [Paenibacillus sp. p3-SID867]|uniref:VOC family protein n=1 Tax=Paenibacillus sp. p3-SID867 TaxID=2916363 RepID=UPI0021A437BF|nr:VOC family protein [Paenibacillus sp. p3-SID867]MCT1400836.1 VOC family protein [Paenibacillus sp. p3-SID867]
MIFEMTIQVRVSNIVQGQKWYETLLNRKPDFIPHEGFAEWELIPGCWLQVAEGTPTEGNGPLRLGTTNIEVQRDILVKLLKIDDFEIYSRPEVPVKWGTFSDPWGNRLGFFEYLNKSEEQERIKTIIGSKEIE